MSALSDEHVIERIETLADVAITEVDPPPIHLGDRPGIDVAAASPPTGRARRLTLVAASVTALVVGAGAVWSMRPEDGVRAIEVDPAGLSAKIDAVIPATWPAELNGPVLAHVDDVTSGAALDPTPVAARAVLTKDGRAAAVVQTVDLPYFQVASTVPEPAADDVGTDGDGRTTHWRERADGSVVEIVALAPGRSLVITARPIERAAVEQVASSLAAADGVPANAALPDGWAASDEHADLTDLFVGGGVSTEWPTVSRSSSDSRRHLSVSTMSSSNPDDDIRRIDELAGTTGRRVDVAGSDDAVLVPLSTLNDASMSSAVVWSPAPGLVSVALSADVDPEQIIAVARSTRRATRAEWDGLVPQVDLPATVEHDGFTLPATATVLVGGEHLGLPWVVVSDRPEHPPESEDLSTESLGLLIRDEQGRQAAHWQGLPDDPGVPVIGSQRFGPHVVVSAILPAGATDVVIQRGDEVIPVAHVALPDHDRTLHFTVVPGRDIDNNRFAVLQATLPDGSQFVQQV